MLIKNTILHRWLKTFNIKTASNNKQRNIAKSWAGDSVKVEETPFTFEIKDQKGKYEVRTSPWGYIYDLQEHIVKLLDCLKK